MQVTEFILVAFLVWQVSAMPVPVWLATAFFGVDANDYNAKVGWAENKFAFENSKWSLIVFLSELLKGFAAISLILVVTPEEVFVGGLPFKYILAVIALLGHTFPIYNEFKRTFSMGAYFGVFAGLWLMPTLIALSIFVAIWIISKKVSISSLIMSFVSLVSITFIFTDVKALVIAAVLSSLLIFPNIKQRLEVVRA